MSHPRTPDIGGGGPIVGSSATIVPDPGSDGGTGQCQGTISASDEARDRGSIIEQMVLDAIAMFARSKAKSVRELGRLIREHPGIVLRVPEAYLFLEWLEATRKDDILGRLLGEAGRGRKPQSYGYLVGTIDAIVAHERCSVAKACQIAARRYGEKLGNVSASRLQNTYSEHRRRYHALRQGYYLPASVLTTHPWKRKESRQ